MENEETAPEGQEKQELGKNIYDYITEKELRQYRSMNAEELLAKRRYFEEEIERLVKARKEEPRYYLDRDRARLIEDFKNKMQIIDSLLAQAEAADAEELDAAIVETIQKHISLITDKMKQNAKEIEALQLEIEQAPQAAKIKEQEEAIKKRQNRLEAWEKGWKAKREALNNEKEELEAKLEKHLAFIARLGKRKMLSEDELIVKQNIEEEAEEIKVQIAKVTAKIIKFEKKIEEKTLSLNEEISKLEAALSAIKKEIESEVAKKKERLLQLEALNEELNRHLEAKVRFLQSHGVEVEETSKDGAKTSKDGAKLILPKEVPKEVEPNQKEPKLLPPKRVPEEITPDQKEPGETVPTNSADPTRVISDYVALLRAKEKWRNRFKGNFMRRILLVRKDDAVLANENQIRQDFRELVRETLNASPQRNAALKSIYEDIGNRLNRGDNVTSLEKTLRWLRKPAVAIGRVAIGAGLVALGSLSGGAVGVAAIATGGVLGGIGRFVGVDAAWDRIRHAWTGREKNKHGLEYAASAQVFYNNVSGAKLEERVNAIGTENVEGTANNVDNAFIKYAENTGKNRMWKRLAALAAAFIPPIALKYLAGGEAHPQAGTGKAIQPSETNASPKPAASEVQPQAGTGKVIPPEKATAPPKPASEGFTVPDKGGIWHISEQIAQKYIPEFKHLPSADKNVVVDAIKDYIIQEKDRLFEPHEVIPRPIENGGPWLKKGADMAFNREDLLKAIENGVPKRIRDILGTDLKGGIPRPKSLSSDIIGKGHIKAGRVAAGRV
ncbi:MAG: hypothetical protein N3G22_00570 [Candidatus Micrarchaeota archaeon]|nr:hypothetical protein [Candidatus Micrarchaeota archaeon]